ncbi:FHA domain-containing protein, partial [Actinacidiphila oryziradicis]
MNGTFVNGRRVMGAVVVRPGDQVTFGRMSYRLAAGQA